MFSWRRRIRALVIAHREVGFIHADRTLNSIFGKATGLASARSPARADGTNSLDFLVTAIEAKSVARLLRKLDVDQQVVVRRANAARGPIAEPGLTPDAKLVVEAAMQRAMARTRDATPVDLFVALAATPGGARDVLLESGLDDRRLAALIE